MFVVTHTWTDLPWLPSDLGLYRHTGICPSVHSHKPGMRAACDRAAAVDGSQFGLTGCSFSPVDTAFRDNRIATVFGGFLPEVSGEEYPTEAECESLCSAARGGAVVGCSWLRGNFDSTTRGPCVVVVEDVPGACRMDSPVRTCNRQQSIFCGAP